MCGIIAADSPIASVVRVLPEGLHHREYRGYDSAGIASYWLESLTSNPCPIEIADEYRCRHSVPNPDQIIVAISKSGETSNTLAVLRYAKNLDHSRMRANRNVRGSALVHECALRFITRAEPEISVTSAKAFTTQQATPSSSSSPPLSTSTSSLTFPLPSQGQQNRHQRARHHPHQGGYRHQGQELRICRQQLNVRTTPPCPRSKGS